MSKRHEEIRSYLLTFLKKNGASTIGDLVRNAPIAGEDCIDKTRARVVALLLALEDQKAIKKSISKQRKAIVWSLVE